MTTPRRIRKLSYPWFEYVMYTEADFEQLPEADRRRDRTSEIPEPRADGYRYLLVTEEA
jgi:hypothetical protein